MTRHLMVDLETLSLGIDAPVLQIGAVEFDPAAGRVTREFSRTVGLASALDHGRLDPGTLLWWLGQSEALATFLVAQEHAVPLFHALSDLTFFLQGRDPGGIGIAAGIAAPLGEDVLVWAHGASFDIPILERLYLRLFAGKRLSIPWHYHAIRDTRTLFWLVGGLDPKEFNKGTKHNALDDAKAQAAAVMFALRTLGRTA